MSTIVCTIVSIIAAIFGVIFGYIVGRHVDVKGTIYIDIVNKELYFKLHNVNEIETGTRLFVDVKDIRNIKDRREQ